MVKQDLLGDGNHINIWSWSINFKDILLDSDFLLPDGAAIRSMWKVWKLFHRFDGPDMIPNLNGTDLLPYFIDNLIKKAWKSYIIIYFLTVYDNNIGNQKWYLLNKCKDYIRNRWDIDDNNIIWYEIDYHDRDYTNWDGWSSIWDDLDNNKSAYRIFLNFRGTPHQEIWTYLNKDNIKRSRLLVFNQWGTVDFRVGKESRAPLMIRKMRLESVRRLFQYPKKNWKKFLISFKMIWLIVKKVMFWYK